MQLVEGNGYHREYFLLDTGSPKSILIAECADNIIKYGSDTTRSIVDIEGVLVELKLQSLHEGVEKNHTRATGRVALLRIMIFLKEQPRLSLVYDFFHLSVCECVVSISDAAHASNSFLSTPNIVTALVLTFASCC